MLLVKVLPMGNQEPMELQNEMKTERPGCREAHRRGQLCGMIGWMRAGAFCDARQAP